MQMMTVSINRNSLMHNGKYFNELMPQTWAVYTVINVNSKQISNCTSPTWIKVTCIYFEYELYILVSSEILSASILKEAKWTVQFLILAWIKQFGYRLMVCLLKKLSKSKLLLVSSLGRETGWRMNAFGYKSCDRCLICRPTGSKWLRKQ